MLINRSPVCLQNLAFDRLIAGHMLFVAYWGCDVIFIMTLHSRTHSHWLKSINSCTLVEIMSPVNLKIINNGDVFICWEDYSEQILALVLRILRFLAQRQWCLFTSRVITLLVLLPLTKHTRHLFITETMFSNNFSKASLIETFWCEGDVFFVLFKENVSPFRSVKVNVLMHAII